jgi:hypothetical protein
MRPSPIVLGTWANTAPECHTDFMEPANLVSWQTALVVAQNGDFRFSLNMKQFCRVMKRLCLPF